MNDSDQDVRSALTEMVTPVIVTEVCAVCVPSCAVTTAMPFCRSPVNVAVATPVASVVEEAVTVPRVLENVTVWSTTGLFNSLRTTARMVVVDTPSALT